MNIWGLLIRNIPLRKGKALLHKLGASRCGRIPHHHGMQLLLKHLRPDVLVDTLPVEQAGFTYLGTGR